MTSSVTPTPGHVFKHGRSNSTINEEEARNALAPPFRPGQDGRSLSNMAGPFNPRNASVASTATSASFGSAFKGANGARPTFAPNLVSYAIHDTRADEAAASERRQAEIRNEIQKETKIKVGSENLLDALLLSKEKRSKEQRLKVESELNSSNRKIVELQSRLEVEIEQAKRSTTPVQNGFPMIFRGNAFSSPGQESDGPAEEDHDDQAEAESPTFLLAEIIQGLEADNASPDYYVLRANRLVDLLKRHPTLKYDLAWGIFGLRIQTMLLSESREVVASGYRVTRHAFADRKSLQNIRALNTDILVVVSLAKDSKSTIEREQALKFVRAFLDVKDGAQEISNSVVRAIVAVAEQHDDRLRNIAVLTLAEIMVRNPVLLARAGGITPLAEALKDGNYPGSESLAAAFLRLTDGPEFRKLLFSGQELAGPFGLFSDALPVHGHEDRLKANARSISAILSSWPGLFALSQSGFASIASLLMALSHPSTFSRNLILDLLFDILNIRPPAWTSSFLAGRRLTTYGRVANLREDPMDHHSRLENEDDLSRANLVDHYTALMLLIFIRCGLIQALSEMTQDSEDLALQRKATLLLSEVLKLADHALPASASHHLQALPEVMKTNEEAFCEGEGAIPSNMAFQMDTVNKTLHRTAGNNLKSESRQAARTRSDSATAKAAAAEAHKSKLSYDMDEIQFRSVMADSQVVAHAGYYKWKWEVINDIIDGPLRNPKRLEDAKSTKFLKRLLGFYRPFKHTFADVRNTKPSQRYVRTACALLQCLLGTPEGVQFLVDNKLLRQLAECLAQLDHMSGITSSDPIFSPARVRDTLTGSYFKLLGTLSSDPQGLLMLSRWRILNMFYHIIDLTERDDIVRLLLENMDFTIESHLRVMLSKALTSGPKSIRTFATKLLRKYATQEIETTGTTSGKASDVACWAIKLLVTQLYDPDVEVSEVAVHVLQEACNRKQYLEYVVKLRPALDHLGEIGAPLLLRFLSTSLGYQYLHGLDYITQEMDDWFLGRNEKYVTLVEASINRGFMHEPERKGAASDENVEKQQLGIVPPHFYRELTRTEEGCQLLRESGHFEEMVSTIKDFWAVEDNAETILKVKGCLWAVGNVGSMELGAPFLEKSNVVQWIIKIVEHSGIITMRGTAFFVLGLISRSWHGMEILADQGWDAATNHLGQSLGYVLPPSLNVLFSVGLLFSYVSFPIFFFFPSTA